MEFETIEGRVRRAVSKLEDLDTYLIEHEVHEQAISHKLAEYIHQEFPMWNVDCEYNSQDYDTPKKLEEYPKEWVRPDIIVHRRGPESDCGENLLIIEVKTRDSTEHEFPSDEEKIEAFIDEKHFDHGLFIDMRKERSGWLNWDSD
jgi:hypothetical protein